MLKGTKKKNFSESKQTLPLKLYSKMNDQFTGAGMTPILSIQTYKVS